MHSCDAAPPPVQGAALLLELGTLIIEGRASPRHPNIPQPSTITTPTASASPHNAYGRANSAELQSQLSPERFHSRTNSFGSKDQRYGEDPEQSNATNATIKDTNNSNTTANTSFVRNASLEKSNNLNTPSAASTTANFVRHVSGEQVNNLNTPLEQSNNLNTSSAATSTASFVRHASLEQSNNSATASSACFGGGGSSEDGEGLRRKEDVNRKLLSALLGVKIYQRVQFGIGEEEQEKVCIYIQYVF